MKYQVCAIYDRKVDSMGTQNLLLYINDDIAKRAIHAAVLDASMEYSRYAADFSLWHIGDFDSDNGVIVGIERRKITEFDAFVSGEVANG